jgi:hypothetical protein
MLEDADEAVRKSARFGLLETGLPKAEVSRVVALLENGYEDVRKFILRYLKGLTRNAPLSRSCILPAMRLLPHGDHLIAHLAFEFLRCLKREDYVAVQAVIGEHTTPSYKSQDASQLDRLCYRVVDIVASGGANIDEDSLLLKSDTDCSFLLQVAKFLVEVRSARRGLGSIRPFLADENRRISGLALACSGAVDEVEARLWIERAIMSADSYLQWAGTVGIGHLSRISRHCVKGLIELLQSDGRDLRAEACKIVTVHRIM